MGDHQSEITAVRCRERVVEFLRRRSEDKYYKTWIRYVRKPRSDHGDLVKLRSIISNVTSVLSSSDHGRLKALGSSLVDRQIAKSMRPRGVVVACRHEESLYVAGSLCRKGDPWNKYTGLWIAIDAIERKIEDQDCDTRAIEFATEDIFCNEARIAVDLVNDIGSLLAPSLRSTAWNLIFDIREHVVKPRLK